MDDDFGGMDFGSLGSVDAGESEDLKRRRKSVMLDGFAKIAESSGALQVS